VLENHDLRARLVPEEVLRTLDPQLLSFLNLNTPEDVESARHIVEQGGCQEKDTR
jgi:hypothetical protein